MLNQSSNIPLYIQLYQQMFDNIASQRWPEHTQLPTESELCEQYGVSRMTVRLALDKLKGQGYLYRKQGKGTFVTLPGIQQPLTSFYSFSEEANGAKRHSNVLSFETIACGEAIAAKLGVPLGEPVFKIERVRSIGNSPFVYELSYIPCRFCPALNAVSITENGLYKSLQSYAGICPNMARESFSAVPMGKNACVHLQGKPSQPALNIHRIAYVDDMIVEYCNSIVRGDRITYQVDLHRL